MRLTFRDQSAGDEVLLLFWRVARRLRDYLEKLPELKESHAQLHLSGVGKLGPNTDLSVQAQHATAGSVTFTLQTLPEEQFEVLALRFRPFFAKGERVNYLSILSMVGRDNEKLRPRLKELRHHWETAAFWHSMKFAGFSLPVDAENIITTAFYSKYFHVEAEKQSKAEEYRKSLGGDLFEVAVVSSVWQRSLLVVGLLPNIETHLLEQGVLTQEEVNTVAPPPRSFVKVTKELGPGGVQVLSLEEAGMVLPTSAPTYL